MVSLEQIKLLESKVSRTIDYVKKVTEENAQLAGKLDSYQKRIEELEVLVQRFKEEQSRIEDGILSALDRLNQFEDAVESTLSKEGKLPAESPAPKEKEIKDEKTTPAPPKAGDSAESSVSEEIEQSAGELDIF